MRPRLIITIDGPAGAGKSTLGRRLAQSLGYLYLDSGALYRAVAWQSGQAGVNPDDADGLEAYLEHFAPQVEADPQGFHLSVNGRRLTWELRTPETTRDSSRVAIQPAVRRWVLRQLRDLAGDGGVVAEGRDMGSVVFPEAQVKFYLEAGLEVRAARRKRQWQNQGEAVALEGVQEELARRDRRDETRSHAPLTVPQGAVCLDTSNLEADQIFHICLRHIRKILEGGGLNPEH
ncbi:MAG: (d)CMP kinase [Deltaproteobacteria bacterium]|nr:(d)CMP kinase [Deltaproteobacteria bacterium]